MKSVVDHYIKLDYPWLLRRSIHNHKSFLNFRQARLNCFEWIKHLKLSIELSNTQIDSIKYVLNQIESLSFTLDKIGGDLYEILKHCTQLKYLSVISRSLMPATIFGPRNKWLLRQYPTLKHFRIEVTALRQKEQLLPCPELLTFLQQNPNIRIFSTFGSFLLTNPDIFFGSNIELDCLDIKIGRDLNAICNLTADLYEQGFYKKLHLEVLGSTDNNPNDNDLGNLWAFCNIEKLMFRSLLPDFPVPIVKSIKELSFDAIRSPLQNIAVTMSNSLINLRRVNLQLAHLRHILAFLSYAPKLTQIRIYRILFGATDVDEDDNEVKPTIDDFLEFNEKRKSLVGACKVTIYVDEELFFNMKWSAKVKHFDMIELKRINSCEIEHVSIEENILEW